MTGSHIKAEGTAADETHIRIYDGAVFYDGYRMADNPDSLLQDGILRHSCSLYSTRLSDEQLDKIGETLRLDVVIDALCDNYDRIGNINIALTKKGAEKYNPSETQRIEIGRFITPFMNKNKQPSSVPYTYDISYLSTLLRDRELRDVHDFWLELEVFGIPYDANKKIAGCADRNDVFAGNLELVTDSPAAPTTGNVLVPIVIKKPEYIGANLNNYHKEATDTLGKTTKTYTFNVPTDVEDAQLVLITSNHGANTGGEEYSRRWHFVYVDGELALTYRPGRDSCEPFRKYNTQGNLIYGKTAMSDKEWQSFSNWCPGDVIDNRIISLGAYKAGEHKVMIRVPSARFQGKQGDIPVSLYFQGLTEGKIEVSGVEEIQGAGNGGSIVLQDGFIRIAGDSEVRCAEVYTVAGELVWRQWNANDIPVNVTGSGVFVVCVEFADGTAVAKKVML